MRWMVASVAAIALATGTGLAQPQNGNGNNGKAKGPAMAQERGAGNGNAMRPGNGNGNGNRNNNGNAMRPNNGNGQAANPGNGNAMRPGNSNGNAMRADPGPPMRPANNGNGNGNSNRASDGRNFVERTVDRAVDPTERTTNVRRDGPARYFARDYEGSGRHGLIDGCPPGLAQKNNGCMPPGQAKKQGFLRRDAYDAGWWGLPAYNDGRFRYDSGYLLRLGPGGGIASYIPLLGGALSVGNLWPSDYGYTGLAPYYQNYYGLGSPSSYRMADNVIYRMDPETAAITSVAALLTGDDFVVGQPAPRGYDVYNVPYSYRDRYYDTPDAHYRYSDGYIYQIDPETRLVAAAIEMLVS